MQGYPSEPAHDENFIRKRLDLAEQSLSVALHEIERLRDIVLKKEEGKERNDTFRQAVTGATNDMKMQERDYDIVGMDVRRSHSDGPSSSGGGSDEYFMPEIYVPEDNKSRLIKRYVHPPSGVVWPQARILTDEQFGAEKVAQLYHISGRVQGVTFREHVVVKAQQLNLKGWVRNLVTGQVEVHAEGTRKACWDLEQWLRNAQVAPRAKVKTVKVSQRSYTGYFRVFKMKRNGFFGIPRGTDIFPRDHPNPEGFSKKPPWKDQQKNPIEGTIEGKWDDLVDVAPHDAMRPDGTHQDERWNSDYWLIRRTTDDDDDEMHNQPELRAMEKKRLEQGGGAGGGAEALGGTGYRSSTELMAEFDEEEARNFDAEERKAEEEQRKIPAQSSEHLFFAAATKLAPKERRGVASYQLYNYYHPQHEHQRFGSRVAAGLVESRSVFDAHYHAPLLLLLLGAPVIAAVAGT